MPGDDLFDDGDEAPQDFRIDKTYASEFQSRKQREELKRAQETGELDGSSSSEESESSEDEEGNLLTAKLDVDIIKTITALRNKDEKIYDPNVRFFEDNNNDEAASSSDESDDNNRKPKAKPKRYKDMAREQVLQKMQDGDEEGSGSESDGEDQISAADSKYSRFAYDAEQQQLRQTFLDSTDGVDEDAEGLLVVRKGTRSKINVKETDKDREELLEHMKRLEDTTARNPSQHKLVDPKGEVQDGEKFLLDYFKNRSWVDKDADDDFSENDDLDERKLPHLPLPLDGEGHESEDSLDQVDKADEFESKYNFRFEEEATKSGAYFSITGYARGQTMNTLRRKDQSRRDRRMARKARKAAERRAKEEQLKRLKNAKRQEMEEKLQQVKRVMGVAESKGGAVDETALMKMIEGDYDPDKFEELMKETYGDDYYQQEDTDWKDDTDVRAALKQDEDGDLLVGHDGVDGGLYDTAPDANYDNAGYGDEDAYKGEAEMFEEDEGEEPETELEHRVKEKMTDELYKLDYEDIVAGMPTRFKYRRVEPNSYGLSTEEILFSRDSTLRQFVSLKKMAPYREQEYVVGNRKQRRFRELAQRDLEEVAAEEGGGIQHGTGEVGGAEIEAGAKKKKGRRLKKKKKKESSVSSAAAVKDDSDSHLEVQDKTENVTESSTKKRRRRKKRSTEVADTDGKVAASNEFLPKKRAKKSSSSSIEGVPASRLASYGI